MRSDWLAELWKFRELLYFLAWREVKIRYKQAALGAAWAVLQPLLGMVVFSLFFGKLAGIAGEGIPYPLFVYCALVPWTYFTTVLGQGANSLVGNSNLITKVYFPRVLLPAASAVAGLFDFLISGSVLIVLMVYYHIRPSTAVLFVVPIVLVMIMMTLGISMLLAAVNVRYRDVKYVVPFLLQLWLFCTPVIYPISAIPTRLRPLLALNPCFAIVEGFRAAMLPGRGVDTSSIAVSVAVSVALFGAGALYFRRTERAFADII